MEGRDINQEDYIGHTPLVWAVENGTRKWWKYCSNEITLTPINQICIAKCQARQIRLRRPVRHSFGLLQWVLYEGVAGALLRRGEVDPNKLDQFDRAPL